jgi:HSP20 family molecular chaperone IbpA
MGAKQAERREDRSVPEHRFDNPFPALPRQESGDFHLAGGAADSELHRTPPFRLGAAPAVTLSVSHGIIHVEADLPGLDTSGIVVSVCGDMLVLKGCDCRYGAFQRAVRLPVGGSADHLQISLRKSGLAIDLPVCATRGQPEP